jgi:hypothetical protein
MCRQGSQGMAPDKPLEIIDSAEIFQMIPELS